MASRALALKYLNYTHIVHDAGIADDLVARKCTSASINVCMRVCRQDIVKQNPLAACLSPCLHTHPRFAGRVTRSDSRRMQVAFCGSGPIEAPAIWAIHILNEHAGDSSNLKT